jgi:hypothetical protein
MEVQHALVALSDAAAIGVGERCRRAVRQRSDQVFGLLRFKIQLGRGPFPTRLQSGTHGMVSHQSIQFSYCGIINRTTTFPRDDLFPQSFPQFSHGLHNPPGSARFPPSLLKIYKFARTKQTGCLKPP